MESSKKFKMDICIAWEEIETTNGFQKMWVLRYGTQKLSGCSSQHKFILQHLRLALRCNDVYYLKPLYAEFKNDDEVIKDIEHAENQYHVILEYMRRINTHTHTTI